MDSQLSTEPAIFSIRVSFALFLGKAICGDMSWYSVGESHVGKVMDRNGMFLCPDPCFNQANYYYGFLPENGNPVDNPFCRYCLMNCCCSLLQKDGVEYYRYGGWWSVWWMGTYSMVLSKAAFFHRKYLDLYTYKMPSSIHDYVTRERYSKNLSCSLVEAFYIGVVTASFSESCLWCSYMPFLDLLYSWNHICLPSFTFSCICAIKSQSKFFMCAILYYIYIMLYINIYLN